MDINQSSEASVPKESQNVNLVQSIIKFDCNDYNEEEDVDYQPDPEVEEEIIQEYQTEAEHLIADKVYHEFVDNLNASQNIDNLEDTADDNDFIAESEDEQDSQHDEKQEVNEDNGIECDSAVYDSTCTETEFETDLEEENVKSQIDGEELSLLSSQIPVKVPISSLHANQTAYPPFWRVKHALQNVDSEQEADPETDPDFNPLPKDVEGTTGQEDSLTEMESRSLQLRHRIVQVKGCVHSDTSDSSSESEEEDGEEDDEELKAEVGKLKELEDLSQQVKGMVDMVEEMSFVEGAQDNDDPNAEKGFCGYRFVDTEKSQNILGISNHFQTKNISQPASIVDAISKFDDQTYEEDEDADYYPNENKENEVCMQEC